MTRVLCTPSLHMGINKVQELSNTWPHMSDLTALKIRKLGQQQELAEEFNLILTRQVQEL